MQITSGVEGSSDARIVYFLRQMNSDIAETQVPDFVKLALKVRNLKRLRQIPALRPELQSAYLTEMQKLGAGTYYVAITQSLDVQKRIGALLLESNLKTQLGRDSVIRKLQYRALCDGAVVERLALFQRKYPTACQAMCVYLLNNCRTLVDDAVFDFLAPYLQYTESLTYEFMRLYATRIAEALIASFVGHLGKDDPATKYQILQLLISLPRDINLQGSDFELFYRKLEACAAQPQMKQLAVKTTLIFRGLGNLPRKDPGLTAQNLEQQYAQAKQMSDYVDFQAAFCRLYKEASNVGILFEQFCICVYKAYFCVGEIHDFLLHYRSASFALETALRLGAFECMAFLRFGDENIPLVQLIRILFRLPIDYNKLKKGLLALDCQIVDHLAPEQQKTLLQRICYNSMFPIFLVKQLDNRVNFTDYEIYLMKTTDLVDRSLIPEEKQLRSGMSLKQEQEIKVHNKNRLLMIDKKTTEENELRLKLRARVAKSLEFLLTVCECSAYKPAVFTSVVGIMLRFAFDLASKYALDFGLARQTLDLFAKLLSRRSKGKIVVGTDCQPLLCTIALGSLFPGMVVYNTTLYEKPSFFSYCDSKIEFSEAIFYDLKLTLAVSFNELHFYQVIAVYKMLIPSMNLNYKSLLAYFLNQAYEILPRIPNHIDDFEAFYLVFALHETNYYILLKIVYNLFYCCKNKNVAFDQHFIAPIIDNLVLEDDSCKYLAYLSLSHVPTNYNIELTNDLRFKLLLAEYLGDSVRRFFLSVGKRYAYIAHLKDNINELFEECFITKYNYYLLELLPAAVQTICEQISEQGFISDIVATLLRYHFDNQLSLEESRYDTALHGSNRYYCIRKCIWRVFQQISKMLVSYNAKAPIDLPLGLLTFSYSNRFPILAKINPDEEEDYLSMRKQLLRQPMGYKDRFRMVSSIYEENSVIEMLRKHECVDIETDPFDLSLIGVIFERFLHSGLFEYDYQTFSAARNAIVAIIEYMGYLYNQQLQYFLETGRQGYIASTHINPIVYAISDRLIQFASNIKRHGVPHRFTIDGSQLEGLDDSIVGTVIEVLGRVAAYVLYEDECRWKIIQFIEAVIQYAPLSIAGTLQTSLQDVWYFILSGTSVGLPKTAKTEHYRYRGPEEFARQYLIPRYIDTIKFSAEDFPGALFCLVGIVQQLGLSYVFYRENIIETVVCYCIKQSDVLFQDIGLTMIAQLILAFGRKMEPYYCIFISDILYLSASEAEHIQKKALYVVKIMLKNLSLFGVSSVLNVLVDALYNDVDWQLKKGACDLVYMLCSNSAKIPLTQFRYLMAKMLPVLLPALHPNINHPHYMVKDAAISTIEKVADSVQNQQIKQISRKIIEAYSDSAQNRYILIYISSMTFTHYLDAASLTLIYPICDSVLSASSSYIYAGYNDAMKDIHTKIIGCSCLTLLSKISKALDFKQYIPRLISLLKLNLDESNDEIKLSAANTISEMLFNYPLQCYETEADLWEMVQTKLTGQQQHGVAQALVNVSFYNETWEGLLYNISSCFAASFGYKSVLEYKPTNCAKLDYTKCDLTCITLMLLYLPQKIIYIDAYEVHELFMARYFCYCFELIFFAIYRREFELIYDYIYKMARQLSTSFLQRYIDVRQIVGEIRRNVLAPSKNARMLAITLIGDIISELGSTDSDADKEGKELYELREDLITVSFYKDDRKQTKVFIPEQAISYATRTIGEDEYYKLMASLFIIRCDETHGIRSAAVGMWKLTTFKPMSTIGGLVPYLFDILAYLLQQHYDYVASDIDYKDLVANFVHEMMTTVHYATFYQFIDQLYALFNSDSVSEENLLFLLDIYSFIAKNDTANVYITQYLIDRLPVLLASSANKDIINSSAYLFTSLKCDVSSILESLVNPQITKLVALENQQDIADIVNSVLVITQTEPYIVSLLEFSLNKSKINTNTVLFYKDFFYRSRTMQQHFDKLLTCLVIKLTANLEQSQGDSTCYIGYLKDCDPVYQIFYNCVSDSRENELLRQNVYDFLLQQVFGNIYQISDRQKQIALIVGLVLIYTFPVQVSQNKAFTMAIIHAFTTNTTNGSLFKLLGYCLTALNGMFELLAKDYADETFEFLRLFVNYFYLNLRRVVPVAEVHGIFLAYNRQMLELFKIFCWVIYYRVRYDDTQREESIKSMVLMILLTLYAWAVSSKASLTKFTYDDMQFTISTAPEASKLVFLHSSSIIGRIISSFKQEIPEGQRLLFCATARIIFQLCGSLQQFEVAIRTDIERKCLLCRNQALYQSAVDTLIELNKQSLRKEQNIVSLLSLLFTNEQTLRKLDTQTQMALMRTLQALLHGSRLTGKIAAKPGDLIIEQGELYIYTARLAFELIAIPTDQEQVLHQAAAVIAECILAQAYTDDEEGLRLLERLVTNPERHLPLARAYLAVLYAVIRFGLVGGALECTSRLLKSCFYQRKLTVIQYLDEKTAFCPDSQLEELGRSLCVCAWLINLYSLTDEHQQANQARNCFSKIASILSRKLESCSYECKCCASQAYVELGYIESYDVRKQLGIVSLQFIQQLLMDKQVGNAAQNAIIEFFRLRIGPDEFQQVFQVVALGDSALAEDMKHRVEQMCKQIKSGKI